MTRDQFIAKALEFKRNADEAHANYMRFLMDGEIRFPDIWQQFGTFETFLRDTHLCDASVYTKFKRACAEMGADITDKIGTFGAIEAVRVQDPARRAEVVRSLTAWVDEHKSPPTQRLAHSHVVALDPRVRTPQSLHSKNRIDALERENAALRQQVRALTVERDQLAKRLAKQARPARTAPQHAAE